MRRLVLTIAWLMVATIGAAAAAAADVEPLPDRGILTVEPACLDGVPARTFTVYAPTDYANEMGVSSDAWANLADAQSLLPQLADESAFSGRPSRITPRCRMGHQTSDQPARSFCRESVARSAGPSEQSGGPIPPLDDDRPTLRRGTHDPPGLCQ